ncbi:RNA methyltransferase [Desulfonema ishimotonii]|uniref:RNA methyltransferase n=1 Tax=Desulfonema ishimotonii TaxID=45657 RepID=A0A401FYX7_9BACT|nr:THUMP domain-containing protein [Desulfonema ishimotonii]GBC62153.1 RNA methyltransferase [Desulfonema ishimotonii]
MIFTYQKTNRFFAQISRETEELGMQELAELGAEKITQAYRGVYFTASPECLYRVNYMSRTLSRVLAPLITFRCSDTDFLYRKAQNVYWPGIFRLDNTFAVFANVSDSGIGHSQYAALCLKDAIVDQFRKKFRRRPSVEPMTPDLWINLHIHKDQATISLDTSGGSLHRRGYRKASLEAPMQETVAAAVIRMSGWDGEKPLNDPMCGGGTLLTEAMMHYCRIPAAYLRPRFGFRFLPDFNPKIWQAVRKTAEENMRPLPEGLISGSDASPHAIAAAEMNNRSLPGGDGIGLRQHRFQELPGLENSVIISNPPYGIRMGKREDMGQLIKEFGDFLKQRCTGSEAYLYFGDREMIKKIGLRPAWKRPLRSGGLDGRLVKYELY